MTVCCGDPAPAKTASPSFIAFPLIFKSGTYSSTASAQVEKMIFLIDVTFVGTVKELLWLAPAKLSKA